LQSDSNVKKINTHITKKVADKLSEIFRNDREGFEEKWDSLDLFVKYGMLSDEKFQEKAKDFCLLRSVNENKLYTVQEYKNLISALQTDKNGKIVVLYTDDAERQHTFVEAARRRNYDVVQLGSIIDSHFVGHLEMKEENLSLKRVDSDTLDKLIEKDEARVSLLTEEEETATKASFENITKGHSYSIRTEALSTDDLPVMITRSEFMRRMKEMSKTGGGMFGMGSFPETYDLVLNTSHPYLKKIATAEETAKEKMAQQALDLALLSQGMLQGEALTRFINRTIEA
jgi:molecular chaperone HtpG